MGARRVQEAGQEKEEMRLVFDTETTGVINYKMPITHPSQPRIVQLGALLTDTAGLVKGELNVLIKPDGWTIPAEATAIHGISTEDCAKYGIPIRSALGMFNLWLFDGIRLIAHNDDFDHGLVKSECARLGKESILEGKERFCTMKAATPLLKIPGPRGFKWPKLQELHKFLFEKEFENAHSAMDDVRACARCFFEMEKRNLVPTTL